jgi:uncharacterized phage protein gp47/JayE
MAAEIQDLDIPEFLQDNDVDDIHEQMLAIIPDEYDKSEGQHIWNFTRPTAVLVSQLRGYDLPNSIELIWPKFCTGEYLDYHAELRGLTRKAAQYATGTITFTGTEGLTIPAGYTCSTESINDIPSYDYVTTEEATIGSGGTVTVPAQAATAGSAQNTGANTVVLNSSGYDDITAVTNPVAFTGGVDEESDESLLERIQEYDSLQGDSGVGNPADYKRWAESVPGTGSANVIRATESTGLVTIVLTDGNGNPASTELCQEVYDYIMAPNNEYARLAPIGATLQVIPPATMTITITANVVLTTGTVESVAATLAQNALEYFQNQAVEDGRVLYQKVANILGDIPGVYDFNTLTLNGAASNITLPSGTYPTITASDITLTLITE